MSFIPELLEFENNCNRFHNFWCSGGPRAVETVLFSSNLFSVPWELTLTRFDLAAAG